MFHLERIVRRPNDPGPDALQDRNHQGMGSLWTGTAWKTTASRCGTTGQEVITFPQGTPGILLQRKPTTWVKGIVEAG